MSSGIASMVDSNPIREFVAEKLSQAKRQDFYALVGVPRSAGQEEIDRAYRVVLGKLETRELKRADNADLWLPVQRIQREIARAYSVLSEPHRRAGYDRRIGKAEVWPVRQAWSAAAANRMNGVPSTAVAKISAIRTRTSAPNDRAAAQHAKAEAAWRQGDWEQAESLFRDAVRLDPEEPGHQCELGWLIFTDKDRLTPARLRMARDMLQDACIHGPWCATNRYRMAQFWREMGNERRYELELQATVRCDHEHEAAVEELRLLGEGSEGRAEDDQGGWSRFWRRLSAPHG